MAGIAAELLGTLIFGIVGFGVLAMLVGVSKATTKENSDEIALPADIVTLSESPIAESSSKLQSIKKNLWWALLGIAIGCAGGWFFWGPLRGLIIMGAYSVFNLAGTAMAIQPMATSGKPKRPPTWELRFKQIMKASFVLQLPFGIMVFMLEGL